MCCDPLLSYYLHGLWFLGSNRERERERKRECVCSREIRGFRPIMCCHPPLFRHGNGYCDNECVCVRETERVRDSVCVCVCISTS